MARRLFSRKTGEPMTETYSKRMARILLMMLAALVVALGAGVAHEKPANAANGLEPILDCVTYYRDQNSVVAYFGYINNNGVPVTPAPSDNYFDPPPFFRGQPTTFQPGVYNEEFAVYFSADGYLTWNLFGSSVTASNDPNLYCGGPPDTVPPNTVIIEGPTGTVSSASATFELFASESGSSFECKLDDGDFAGCDTPETLSGLSDGSHTFQARATDAAGNTDPSPAKRTWTVDTTAPDAPTITSPADGAYDRDGSFNVRGAAEPGSMVRLYEGTTRVGTSETDPTTGEWSIALVDVPDGSHDYRARATDAVGNVSENSAEATVVVDGAAPTITTTAPAGSRATRDADVTATFSERMDEVSIEASGAVRLDLAGKKGKTTPVAVAVSYDPDTKTVTLDPDAVLKRGARYTVTISTAAKDEAGNTLARPGIWTFTTAKR